jgi:hypothetical protein
MPSSIRLCFSIARTIFVSRLQCPSGDSPAREWDVGSQPRPSGVHDTVGHTADLDVQGLVFS